MPNRLETEYGPLWVGHKVGTYMNRTSGITLHRNYSNILALIKGALYVG